MERRLRDLRGRVKHARAVVASTPRLAEALAGDWRKAAAFYARHGISEAQFRYGVLLGDEVIGSSSIKRVSPELPAPDDRWLNEPESFPAPC